MRIKHMSLLARNGIPGPKPNLIIGNLFDFREGSFVETQICLIKRYGKVLGFYVGNKPTVLVADPELAKNIQIKDFQYFSDRPKMTLKSRMYKMLAFCKGEHWKGMRSVLTATFSTSKLKTMTPIIDDTIDAFIAIVDKHSTDGQEFDVFDMFKKLTVDVITRTAFGIESDVQNESSNQFLNAAKSLSEFSENKWLFLAMNCFPILETILYPFRRTQELIQQMPEDLLFGLAKNIIRLRRREPNTRRKDLLQLMIDTKISEEEMSRMTDERLIAGSEEKDIKTTIGKTNGVKTKLKTRNDFTLTEEEIEANCVMFYMAGYETTSKALAFIAHILVNYPDIQERVRQEVTQLYESKDKLDINAINGLEFMESVVKETMRLYPPITTFVSRECLADYKYKDMTIPKGTTVMISGDYMHNDPDYWPEPKTFDPNRFSPERRHEIHPSSWQPFGSGPRNCIAMRFALFQIKLTFAKLLMRYRLVPSPKTEMGELSTEFVNFSQTPKHGVYVKAVKIV